MKGKPAREKVPAYQIEEPAPLLRGLQAVSKDGVRVGAEAEELPARPLAVLVAHGMGQQVPYQTLDDVARGLAEAETRATGTAPPLKAAQDVVGGRPLRYVETRVKGRAVHVFEAYWAPATEGKVTLRDVMAFMVGAGLNGAWRGLRGWSRSVFDDDLEGSRFQGRLASVGSSLALLAALVALLALVAVNAIILAMAGAAALPGELPVEAARPALTRLFLGFAAVALLFAALLVATMLLKSAGRALGEGGARKALRVAWRATNLLALLSGALASLALYAVIFGIAFALKPGLLSAAESSWAWPLARAHGALSALGEGLAGWRGGALAFVLWPGLLLASWFVRRILVQFPGDVVAYVSPHKLDRFEEVRDDVKKRVKDVAQAVYAHRDAAGPVYEGVVVVGHSLGSVAAYDALNGLLNDDALSPTGGHDVAGRTRLLLTFGSPLDKTAFVFATNQRAGRTRESLTRLSQPLLRSYPRYRRFPWVNVHAPWDVISGPLTFYDHPDERARAPPRVNVVKNVPDPDADVLFVAHTEYWDNPLVWDVLRDHL